ncbi:MAG: choice-of-anchor D domain-containing protein, partial [Calditrichaeota bacterium]|nr:choice-of-anchor D domain-containing protein [Calditrichota bacterium]
TYHDDGGEHSITFILSDGNGSVDFEVTFTIEEDHVLNVPDEYETIQAAIDRAADGDTVLVEPGEYVENIDFIGKNIVVLGNPDDPSEVVIDGDENGSVVTMENNEGEGAELLALTITNGSSQNGGGIFLDEASPKINNCIIRNNNITGSGAGIYCWQNSNPIIRNSLFTDNSAENNAGGGDGGGLFANDDSDPVLIGCTIINNFAKSSGGAIQIEVNSTIELENCLIANNSAWDYGTAIFIHGSDCILHITNTTIAFNSSNLEQAVTTIVCGRDVRIFVDNSILWNPDGNELNAIFEGNGSEAWIDYSVVYPGEHSFYLGNGEVNWGEGNIDADPLFADPDNGDYNLSWANYPEYDETRSPCINSGDPESDNDPDDTRADMGAFYFDHEPDNDIAVEPADSINFAEVSVADASDEALTISNVGELSLTVNDIEIDGEGFDVDFEGSFDLESGGEQAFTITFAPEQVGNFGAELTISSNDPNEGNFVITLTGIGVNDAPEIVSPIDDVDLNEDFEPFVIANLSDVFRDLNGDELSFDVVSSDENFIVELIDGSQLQLSAVEHWFGDAVVTVTADDGVGARDRGPVRELRQIGISNMDNPRRDDVTEEQFNVQVNAVNDPPVWTDVPEDTTIAESDLIEFDVVGEDVDNQELTITDDIPDGAEFNDNGDGTGHFRWQTDYDDAGDHTLMFILSDEEYDIETVINIGVTNVNRAPDWTQEPVNQEINENELLEFTISAEDPDGDNINITHRFADLPEAAEFTFDGQNTGTFSWRPTFDDAGEYSAEFTVSDGDLETVSEITINVIHVNRTPAWIDEPVDQEVREGESLSFEI